MIASSILLDQRVAVGTGLGISLDPIDGFRIIVAFFDPHLDNLACTWKVVLVRAFATEFMAILTSRNGYLE